MSVKTSSYKKIFVIALFSIALLITRYVNLDKTARFTQDESSDLARMHQYYKQKKITLVGPISNDNSKVFSSLTYYMVMPFAAAADFVPVGPVYGMAFYGVITAFLLVAIVYKVRKEWTIPAMVFVTLWYPLVEMSRWAWNPHLVVFWAALGTFAYVYRAKYPALAYLVTGFSYALLFHHHYLALLATGPIILYLCFELLKKKEYRNILLLTGAYIAPHLVFVLFDLRHPPGLFFGKYLFSGNTPGVQSAPGLHTYASNFIRNYQIFLDALVKPAALKVLVGVLIPLLIFLDTKTNKLALTIWYLPAVTLVVLGIILSDFQVRYVYPAISFLGMWLILKRSSKLAQRVATSIVVVLLVGSALTIWKQITVTSVPPDMHSLTQMGAYIQKTIRENSVKNSNVAVVASPDSAPLGEKYRDLIGMDGTSLRAASEYEVSENLFAITTSSLEEIQKDQSFAMLAFKNGHLKDSFEVPGSPWRVYWLGY